MKLDDVAGELVGSGADATLVMLNPDGSPQVTLAWVALQSTPEGDELVIVHTSPSTRRCATSDVIPG